jgi:hypothetical protein
VNVEALLAESAREAEQLLFRAGAVEGRDDVEDARQRSLLNRRLRTVWFAAILGRMGKRH